MKRPRWLHVYAFAITGAAVSLLLWTSFDVPSESTRFWNVFGGLLALALVAEAMSLQIGVGTVRQTVSFVPFLAAIILFGAAWAMVVGGVTQLFAETVIRRKPLLKISINTSKEVVALGAAGVLYGIAGGTPNYLEFQINAFAFAAAATTYFILTNGGTAVAVALSSRKGVGEAWNRIGGKGLLEDVLSSSIAVVLAYLYIDLGFFGLVFVVVPLFFVRHALQVNLKLEQANRDLLELMVKSIEARDPYTSGHSVRVAMYAKALARSLGLSAREIEQIETAALLHDVGKIYEEFAPVLRKPDGMTEQERSLMHTHPMRSAELVATISSLRGYVEKCVRAHHENYDGGGYPDGLAGEEIPIGARIIMIADTADAMMTDRPYRTARSYDEVVSELERYAGTQFDPEVVVAFKHSTAVRRLAEARDAAEGPELVSLPARAKTAIAGVRDGTLNPM
jgi:putative nucleotidyltransferase with HDIG domain